MGTRFLNHVIYKPRYLKTAQKSHERLDSKKIYVKDFRYSLSQQSFSLIWKLSKDYYKSFQFKVIFIWNSFDEKMWSGSLKFTMFKWDLHFLEDSLQVKLDWKNVFQTYVKISQKKQ